MRKSKIKQFPEENYFEFYVDVAVEREQYIRYIRYISIYLAE